MTTMTIDRATVEQALEALRHVVRQAQENLVPTIHYGPVNDVINRLEAALAQRAEPVEPVAWLRVIDEAMVTHHLGVADPGDDYETAKRKMNNLLCMAQDIGTYFAKQAEAVEPVAWVGDPSTQDYASTVPDPQVEDRLARHGIPMPEGDPK